MKATKPINPFHSDSKTEYELALKTGNRRFGSECKHEQIKNGRCMNCLRAVVTRAGKR